MTTYALEDTTSVKDDNYVLYIEGDLAGTKEYNKLYMYSREGKQLSKFYFTTSGSVWAYGCYYGSSETPQTCEHPF